MPLEPTWQEIISEAIESRLLELHTAIPGKVISYDKTTQTAEVAPVVQRAEPREDGGNTLTPLPSIPNVPVGWHRGGGAGLSMPLAAGDHVLLIFNEAAIGHWRASGELAPPGDLRRHSLGYPYAIPCGNPDSRVLDDAADSGEVVLTVGDNVFRVGAPSADFVALSAKVDANFKAITDMFSSWTPAPNDGGAALKALASGLSAISPVAATKLKAQ